MNLNKLLKIFNFSVSLNSVCVSLLLILLFVVIVGCRTYATDSEIRKLTSLKEEIHQLEFEVKLLKENELNIKMEDHLARRRYQDCLRRLELIKRNLEQLSGEKSE